MESINPKYQKILDLPDKITGIFKTDSEN